MLPDGPIAKYCELKNCTPDDVEKAVFGGDAAATSVWCAERISHELGQVFDLLAELRDKVEGPKQYDSATHTPGGPKGSF